MHDVEQRKTHSFQLISWSLARYFLLLVSWTHAVSKLVSMQGQTTQRYFPVFKKSRKSRSFLPQERPGKIDEASLEQLKGFRILPQSICSVSKTRDLKTLSSRFSVLLFWRIVVPRNSCQDHATCPLKSKEIPDGLQERKLT